MIGNLWFIFGYTLINPWWLLLAILPLGWYIWKLRNQKIPTTTIFRFSSLKGLRPHYLIQRIDQIKDVLRLIALLSFTIALARPQVSLTEEKVEADSIDIMLAMDLSSSMLAKDFEPDRLSVSKEVAEDFVNNRSYDRLGLVLFAGEAFTQCPLTTDHNILIDFLQNTEVGVLADGTAIGMGLATAVNRLKDSESKSKIVILLTDGVNNTGYIDPELAADIAEEYNIKVYTIGVGTQGQAPTPVNRRSNGQYVFSMARVEIDEALLQNISDKTGGKYYRATDRAELENIYAEIDRLEKTKIEVTTFKRYTEKYRTFLYIGLIILLIELFLIKGISNILE